MNLETKIIIYKFTPQVFTLTPLKCPLLTKFRYKIVTGKSGKSSVTIFDVSP